MQHKEQKRESQRLVGMNKKQSSQHCKQWWLPSTESPSSFTHSHSLHSHIVPSKKEWHDRWGRLVKRGGSHKWPTYHRILARSYTKVHLTKHSEHPTKQGLLSGAPSTRADRVTYSAMLEKHKHITVHTFVYPPNHKKVIRYTYNQTRHSHI